MRGVWIMLLIVSQRGKLQICTLMLGNGQGWAWSDCIVYREIFPLNVITILLQLELLNLIKKPRDNDSSLKQVSFAVLAHSFLITQPTSYQSQRVGNPSTEPNS